MMRLRALPVAAWSALWPPRWPSLRSVEIGVAVWLAACLAVGACVRLQTIEASYVISEQRRLRAQLIEDNRKLDLDLARLSSLDRIEAIASGKLGMRFPSSKEVVKL